MLKVRDMPAKLTKSRHAFKLARWVLGNENCPRQQSAHSLRERGINPALDQRGCSPPLETPLRVPGCKQRGRSQIFTCISPTEELGEMTMQLKEALGLRRGGMVSLIGAGGKTTTMFRLAHELREDSWKVLVTTTTKIFKPAKPHKVAVINHVDAPEDVAPATALGKK